MIDIGANLGSPSFRHDLNAVIGRAKTAGVEKIVVTGSDIQSNETAYEIARDNVGYAYSTAGLHPHHADGWCSEVERQIRDLIGHVEVVAIGETGLDYNRNFSSPDKQRQAFAKHLEIAAQVEKPLFLHQRDAHQDFYAMLSEHPELLARCVVHCFTDTIDAMEAYIELGAMIGITGWICDKKRGENLRNIVSHIPASRLMVESDAPYLMPCREKIKHTMADKNRNEPHTLGYVVKELARCRNETEWLIAETTSRNAKEFFQLT